ncbi:MAG: helix-turn-helix domain-containing protein [Gammaproteobacteria bacterium]
MAYTVAVTKFFAAYPVTVTEYRPGGRGPLLDTLAAPSDHDFALTPTAQAPGVRLNTVKYRNARLRELLGGDPARGELRKQVALALTIRRLDSMRRCDGVGASAYPARPSLAR